MARPKQQPQQTGVPAEVMPDDTQAVAADPLEQADDPDGVFGEGTFLLMDPEVGTIAHAAMRDQWPAEQVANALRQTNAYNEVLQRRQALADPTNGDGARTELSFKVASMMGRTPDDPVVRDYQRRLEQGGATMAALKTMVDPLELGTPTDRVLELARVHGIPMRPETAAEWAGKTEPEVDQLLGQLSQQLYPWKPGAMPHMQYARVFADLYGQEMDQEGVATDNPRLQRLIAEARGDLGVFRQLVRQQPGWEDTTAGREAWQERANQVLDDLMYGDEAAQDMQGNQQMFDIQEGVGQQAANAGMGEGTSYGPGSGTSGTASGLQQTAAAGLSFLKEMFPGHPIGGWRATGSVPGSDHPKGLALDYMIEGNARLGNTIAAYMVANAAQHAVKYVIWNRRIWTPGRGWHAYSGPSPHTDHVHISYYG